MATTSLNTKQITDWTSFHLVCKETFGFPDFYGMNMDAWIDCLSYVDEGNGMSRFHLSKGEMLNIEVSDTADFSSRLPEIFEAFVECTAFVNKRHLDADKTPVLSVVFL